MSSGIYRASVPVFVRGFTVAGKLLDKGSAYAEAKKFDVGVLLTARLAPDMHPIPKQIQIASDAAKGAAARLAGVDIPSFPDTETTLDELKTRIAKTIDFMNGLDAAAFEGAEAREIVLKLGPQEIKMSGADYLFTIALPNFFFHLTTTYNILRHNGVEVGKRDFLGWT